MSTRENHTPALTTLAVFVCLVITGALLYGHILNAPFVFDDTVMLGNPHLLLTDITPAGIAGLTRITTENVAPRILPNLSFALNYYLCRRHVAGYHLVNLLIHIATAGLVFLVCRRTIAHCRNVSALIPVMTGLLWLAHPLHVQTVTYTWQRMNSMGAMFFMLCLYFYISAREAARSGRSRKKATSSILAFACALSGLMALASKQTAAALPVILVLYEWFFFQNLNPAWLKKKLPWIGLAALAAVGLALFYLDAAPVKTILATYAEKSFTPGQRLMTEPQIVLFYITLLLFPHPSRLTIDYDFPVSFGLFSPAVSALAVITLIVLMSGAILMAGRHRLISFAIIWFITNLLIESSIVGLDLIYGYRTYLPSIFPFMALTTLLFRAVKTQTAAIFLLAAAIAVSGLWTFRHNMIWQDEQTLWQDTAFKSPLKARPYHNLGLVYKTAGECEKAVAAYRQALKIRLATTGPDHYKTGETWNNLGAAYDCLGDVDNAADSYQKALDVFTRRFGPDHLRTTGVYNNLCVLYGRNKDYDRAVFWCRKALTVRLAALGNDHPEVADLHNNLGLALAGAKAPDEARKHIEAALEIYQRHLGHQHPKTRQCRQNLSQVQNGA